MSGLGAIQSAIVQVKGAEVVAPVTNSTGGTSQGDSSAGITKPSTGMTEAAIKVTTGDKVASGFLTVAVLGGVIGGSTFMVMGA